MLKFIMKFLDMAEITSMNRYLFCQLMHENCMNPSLIACCSVGSHASQNVTQSGRILKKGAKDALSIIIPHSKACKATAAVPNSSQLSSLLSKLINIYLLHC